MRLAAHQQNLMDELMHLDDPQERLAAAVDRARRAARLSPAERSMANRVPGCSSTVWLTATTRDGRCYFRSDADSPVVRGLVGLLAEYFSDARPAEIAASTVDPLEMLQITRMLTPTRQHGLAAVRAYMQAFATQQLAVVPAAAGQPPSGPARP
jgi:cysteine desulfuration protein SufE